MCDTDGEPQAFEDAVKEPWPIEPDHGMNKGPGYLGDAYHALRVREILKYYQPPDDEDVDRLRYVPPINTGSDWITSHPNLSPGLISSHDPILAAFANLTCRTMNARRCVVSMTAAGVSYVIAESTRSLSMSYPHTHEPGDQLFLGGGCATSSINGLCEHTCSLLPPDPDSNLPYLLEIPDLSVHPKYNNVGYVRGWPHARFYCGAPMRTKNGVTIGTICVMDEKPRYRGLSNAERAQMHDMAELFMRYLETKQGEEERNKSRMMEMELSRFIAEGYLPGEGALMIEKRDGRLWSPEALERRKLKEFERRKKVEERRQIFQEQQYAAMVKQEDERMRREKDGMQMDQGDGQGGTIDFVDDRRDNVVDPTALVPVVKPCQPGLIQLMTREELAQQASLPPDPITESRPTLSLLKIDEELDGTTRVETISTNSTSSNKAPSSTSKKPGTRPVPSVRSKSSTSLSGIADQESNMSSTGSDYSGKRKKLSKYEQTMTLEPQLRQMFGRAAELIRNTLGADVLFVDSDLEGLFEPSQQNPVRGEKDGSWSFVSSDPNTEFEVRSKRPVTTRSTSGVLGYATAQGTSRTTSVEDMRNRNLGFDVSQLTEEDLHHIAKDNKGGRLIAFVDEYPGLEEQPHRLDFTERILQKALPGCKSAVILPLLDHHGKLFSILFAWTRKSDRTFVTEVEGKFVQGVGESIMGEITRLHILAADKAKAEFISSISHELRSPLHGILASADFLLDSDLTIDQRSFIDTIIACGATLLDTVNNVLDFQKLDAFSGAITGGNATATSKTEKERPQGERANSPSVLDKSLVQDTDLSMLVQEITDGVCLGHEFRGLSSGKSTTSDAGHQGISVAHVDKISVILDIDRRLQGWRFLANQSAIKRVISNLVGNALKYSKESGWVRVVLSTEDVDQSVVEKTPEWKGKAVVKLSVIDSGKGMSREFLKTKLFTPFSQENPLSAGAGLGLCIVRQLVQLLDGKINIKSKLGEGTDVSVLMPLEPLEDNTQIVEVPSFAQHKLKALLTGFECSDDDIPTKQGVESLKESVEKYLVHFFGVETISLDEAVRSPKDVFIVCNGASEETAQLLSRVTALSAQLKAAPVVLLCNRSAYTRPAFESFKTIEQRIAYVRKPYGPKRLQNALAFCLDVMKKTGPGPSAAIPDVSPLSTASESQVLDLAIGLREVILTPPESLTRQNSVAPISPVTSDIFPPDFPANPRPAYLSFSEPPPVVSNFQNSNIKPASPPCEAEAGGPAILCVEDNHVNMMLLTKFLKKKAYTFETAGNGLEAVEKAQERAPGSFDIILMDLQMPILSGVEATREIRRLEKCHPERRRSYIVALTGLAAAKDREDAFEAGVDAFMVKPVSFPEMDKIIREHCRDREVEG